MNFAVWPKFELLYSLFKKIPEHTKSERIGLSVAYRKYHIYIHLPIGPDT